MKKAFIISFLFLSNFLIAQVNTIPEIPTSNSEITIIFDATGTELEGYTGAIHAHTGTTENGGNWKHVIGAWGDNTSQPQLTRDPINANKYTLVITPDIYTFYDVDASQIISELGFVFRSDDGSKQSRPDYFIKIYQEGLNVIITQPNPSEIIELNENITISAETSTTALIELKVDSETIATTSNTTSITSQLSFSTTGWHTISAVATANDETKTTTISVFVKQATENRPLPNGAENGININADNSVTFVLLAPKKSTIFLIGDFNDFNPQTTGQMYKDGDYFWITINNLDPDTEYSYQYLIDGTIRIPDPYAEKILDPSNDQYISDTNYPDLKAYPTDKTTGYVSTFKINSISYNWNVQDFTRPTQENLVIYELHIRDFTETDSFNEALTRLDYLDQLGVNAIELMPINEFEGNDSWGYNPAMYMALDKAYGTKNDFKKFVDACHQRGIAVLADVVFNHSYSQSPLLQMYWDNNNFKPTSDNPWYNENHNFIDNTSAHWGYDFNHESAYTKTFFEDVLSYWMTEYKIDGFRFDFTKGMSNTQWFGNNNWASNYDADRIAILKNYANHVWDHDRSNKPYVIFEHLAENSEETELANYGIMLWANMNHSYNQNTMGHSNDSNISWISHKTRGWDSPSAIGYMESHDEERLMYKNLNFGKINGNYSVKNLSTALARQELAGMFFFSIPGPKMIWQFGELGYDISINENGRIGRKPIHWDYIDNPDRKHIYNTWATMIAFKTQYPEVFNTSDFEINDQGLQKSILLKHESMDVVIVGNFDLVESTVSSNFSKTGTWYEYFTSKEINVSSTSENFVLQPGEYRMYATQKLEDPRGNSSDDSDGDGVINLEDLCPNTKTGTIVNSSGCAVFELPVANFSIEVISETCPDKQNGQVVISASEAHDYTVQIDGTMYSFTTSLSVGNLKPGNYDFCINVSDKSYEQCFSIVVDSGTTLSAKSTVSSNKIAFDIKEGTAPFTVFINGKTVLNTKFSNFDLDVRHDDLVEVKTAVSCEGILSHKISLSNTIKAFPNPSNGIFEIRIPGNYITVPVSVYSSAGTLIINKDMSIFHGKIQINLENQAYGLYLAKIFLKDETIALKILKQ